MFWSLSRASFVAAAALTIAATVLGADSNQQIRIEELTSRHLGSIGTDEAIAKVNSRWVEGTVCYERLRDPHPPALGKAFLVSEKQKLRLTMQFSAQGEGGEQVIFDGHKLNVSSSTESFRK